MPPESDPIGSAHPSVLAAADPDARWVVLCQARSDTNHDGKTEVMVGHHGDTYGDELSPYLVVGSGEGIALDAFVTSDPTGRYVAYVQKGKLFVRDMNAGRATEIVGADTRDDPNPFGGHRAASFDARGSKLLYLKPSAIVVRDLTRGLDSGAEKTITIGQRLLWRADLDADGRWVIAWVVAKDTNGDGKLTLPLVRTSLGDRHCRGPITSYSTGGMAGDRPETWAAPASGGKASARGDVIGTLGDGLIVRGQSGLELVQAAKRTQLGPSECDKLLYSDAGKNRVLIGCKDGSEDASYALLWSPSGTKRLGLRTLGGSDQPPGTRFVHVPGYSHDAFVDLDTERVYELREHEWARAADGLRAVIVEWDGAEKHALGWVDLASGKRKRLRNFGETSGYADAVELPMIAIANLVVDARDGRVLGSYEGQPLAIDRHGRLLRGAPASAPHNPLPNGPLRWTPPTPAR